MIKLLQDWRVIAILIGLATTGLIGAYFVVDSRAYDRGYYKREAACLAEEKEQTNHVVIEKEKQVKAWANRPVGHDAISQRLRAYAEKLRDAERP